MKNQYEKLVLVIALISLMGFKSFGQIDLGVKGGINFSTQIASGTAWSTDGVIAGFNVGGIIRYHITEWLAIRSDISYIQKGRRYRNPFEKSTNVPDRFNYIIIPLKAEISVGERVGLNKGQKLIFAAGPYYGFLLNAERKENGTKISLDETTKNYDYGLSLDLGFEFPVKNHSITFGANYETGILKFADYDNELKNNNISLYIGFIF